MAANGLLQRAKPTKKKPLEYLILERRKQEELRDEANALVHYTKQFDLKVSRYKIRVPVINTEAALQTTWEMETDKKIQRNTIKRRVESLLEREKYSLEERRDK